MRFLPKLWCGFVKMLGDEMFKKPLNAHLSGFVRGDCVERIGKNNCHAFHCEDSVHELCTSVKRFCGIFLASRANGNAPRLSSTLRLANKRFPCPKAAVKRAALQTLRAVQRRLAFAKRLDCGASAPLFVGFQTSQTRILLTFRPSSLPALCTT